MRSVTLVPSPMITRSRSRKRAQQEYRLIQVKTEHPLRNSMSRDMHMRWRLRTICGTPNTLHSLARVESTPLHVAVQCELAYCTCLNTHAYSMDTTSLSVRMNERAYNVDQGRFFEQTRHHIPYIHISSLLNVSSCDKTLYCDAFS